MIYPSTFEQKIGFDQIRQLLKKNCSSSLGEEKVDELAFLTNFDALVEQLDRGEEFKRIIEQEQHFPDSFFLDVRPALKRLRIEGTWMDEPELFDLRRSLESIYRIVQFFAPDKEGNTPYPRLSALAGETFVYPEVLKKIDSILSKFGKILDNASPELARIRRELTQTMSGLSRRLNQIMKQAQSEGFVEKDASPSMRDGRLVIPVSPMYKRKIHGIVHDESSTGKTVFIEPEELVEANNKIRELENEERREIIRILTTFSDSIRPFADEMAHSYHFLGEIDFVRSKARFALDINAIRPRMENAPSLDWVKAVHPLLMLSLRKQHKEVVPLTLALNADHRILIISGPNAGGKSVCLKTVGLLQYMIQCGLMIPLHDSSHVGWFERLFIDIGDEQSIENDLSTYSSHLLNMKFFLRHAQGNTLLLIDEFGSGTEPKIGGAMAEACLDRYHSQGAYGVITTHYSNLKHYAAEHEGLLNGAMLYDRHEMRPLFVLETGRPGSSFAIEIARKIGLPEDVIAEASAKVGSDYIDMDKFLQDIVRDKRYWENKRQSIRQQEKRLSELTERYESDLASIHKERKEIISKAKTDASKLLNESNALIENTIRGIKEAQAEKERTRELRKELQGLKDSVSMEAIASPAEDDALIQRRLANKVEKIRRREEEKTKKASGSSEPPAEVINKPVQKKLALKDTVRIKGQNTVGTILEIKGLKAVVGFGSVKTSVLLENLEPAKFQKEKENPYTTLGRRTSEDLREKKLQFRQEIDVRGQRGDEALQSVMYFVDDAIMTGVSRIRILHGTGTGTLRQMIRQYLSTVPGVSKFGDEHIQFGGAGITVVDLD
ncbi:MAG TPA: Smr/MutS family protein [Bacteroidales bacterium]|nr:Smr/MutS family protein [Bacteroidales bacterium]